MLTAVVMAAALAGDPPPPRVQWLLFSMANCKPCQILKGDLRPKLNKAGWVMSSSKSAQIRTIELEKNPELAEHYGVQVYPTMILMRDGLIVHREEGLGKLTAVDVARKYNREMEIVIGEKDDD